MMPSEKTATYERGTYYFFDVNVWKKVPKEFHLDYDKLEDKSTILEIKSPKCDYCFQVVGKGIRHPCRKLDRQRNLASLVRSTSPPTRGIVILI